jgi:saccharopine dehydrogenase (NADP+, L-glutamate forming)
MPEELQEEDGKEPSMKRVLLLGAGLVTRPLVQYLLEQPDIEMTIASRTVSKAEKLLEGLSRGKAMPLLVDNEAELSRLVAGHDLSISLLPYTYHPVVAKLGIQHRKQVVTTSYVSEAMQALDGPAKEAGILILNEVGLDPGIDHMSAMRVIHGVQRKGGRVVSFSSYCGGLPAPEANTNPWGYKFSWSPRGVVMAGRNSGRFLKNGEVVDIPGPDLFAHYETATVPGLGDFEGYTNRDCLGYVEIYGLKGARNMFRGTLRYPGWCDTWKALSAIGYLSDDARDDLQGRTYADLMRSLAGAGAGDDPKSAAASKAGLALDSEPIRRWEWLGLFSDEPLPAAKSATDVLVERLSAQLSYAPGERDMIALHHEFEAEYPEHREKITSTLVDYGIPQGDSAMARTVSLPAAIATKMILDGTIKQTGVHVPVQPEFYNPILDELDRLGITCNECEERVK